jgi:hypothetical protein
LTGFESHSLVIWRLKMMLRRDASGWIASTTLRKRESVTTAMLRTPPLKQKPTSGVGADVGDGGDWVRASVLGATMGGGRRPNVGQLGPGVEEGSGAATSDWAPVPAAGMFVTETGSIAD